MRHSHTRQSPVVVLWEPEPLLAALLLRLARTSATVHEFSGTKRLAAQCREARVLVLVGGTVLSQPDDLRFLHQLRREHGAVIVGCGRISSEAAIVAGELGVATIVQTIHDAVTGAGALRRFLRSSYPLNRDSVPRPAV